MKKIGIFYASSTGYTADVANRIGEELGVKLSDIQDVAHTAPSVLGDYDLIVIGSSTWGLGELQDDMADFLDGAEQLALPGKEVAVFGCGDESMSDTFCAAVGEVYTRMKKTGAKMVGEFNADGYTYNESPAEIDGKIVGLVLDEVNHPDLTDGKIKAWCAEIK